MWVTVPRGVGRYGCNNGIVLCRVRMGRGKPRGRIPDTHAVHLFSCIHHDISSLSLETCCQILLSRSSLRQLFFSKGVCTRGTFLHLASLSFIHIGCEPPPFSPLTLHPRGVNNNPGFFVFNARYRSIGKITVCGSTAAEPSLRPSKKGQHPRGTSQTRPCAPNTVKQS